MLPTAGVALVAVFWLLVYLGDKVLSTKRFSARYRKILERAGITISLLQIRSYTKYFNRWFQHIGKAPGRFMQIWFTAGVVFGGISMLFSVYLLVTMLFKNMTEEKPEQMLTPIIPGVNIPWRHIIYYFLTLAIGGTFHEMGHAIAAARENVRVMGFGWFVMPIFCGAYVELQTDHLQVVSAIRQLRIFCAGVWHNCVSALMAVSLWWCLPYFYVLLYSTESGAVVSDVLKESSVWLHRGDQISSLNNCTVMNTIDYFKCVHETIEKTNQGYCHNTNAIVRRNSSIPYLKWTAQEPECCDGSSPSKFCFSHDILEARSHSCLQARSFVVNQSPCYSNKDCKSLTARICVIPKTGKGNRFIRISHTQGQDILFVGNPFELLAHITVSDYLPKSSLVPLDFPDYIQTMLVYFASLSGALAILNMIPCYCLDGQWALSAFIEYFLPRFVKSSTIRSVICHFILLFGTSLLAVNFIFGLWNLRGQGVLSFVAQQVDPG